MDKRTNIHAGHRERMRQAAEVDPDLSSFSDYQALELFLQFVVPMKDTNVIAHDLINEFGSLSGVFHAKKEELKKIHNMTNNASGIIPFLYPMIRKSEASRAKNKKKIVTVDDAVAVLRPYFLGRYEEMVYCVVMDLNDRILQLSRIGEGLADTTPLNSNKIISMVTRHEAKKVIIAHNHPGGSLQPSREDIEVTKAVFLVLQPLGAFLSDHLIFTEDGYYSFFMDGWYEELASGATDALEKSSFEQLHTCRLNRRYFFEQPKEYGTQEDKARERGEEQ